jgi:predicted metalloenzyme YecM
MLKTAVRSRFLMLGYKTEKYFRTLHARVRYIRSMAVKDIIGDYDEFFSSILKNLADQGIQVEGLPMSHLGYKARTIDEYKHVCNELLKLSESAVENVHNGRPIAKILLSSPLELSSGFSVSLMEIMPPKDTPAKVNGLEHCGFVPGDSFDAFKQKYKSVLTGIQDQGQFCQPAYVVFADGLRVKFYQYSLKKVVELEGGKFESLSQVN